MARLSLSLLGPFQVLLDDEPVSGFESNKARGLLAYLAVEANRPHLREALAGLFWPNSPDRAARGNLRHTLFNLRQAIGDHDADPSFLSITRDTIQFNSASNHVLDVDIFTKGLAAGESDHSEIGRLETALPLYQGSFLVGLSISDTAAFEEWALFKREQLGRLAFGAFGRLAALHEGRGEYDEAQTYSWQQVELEPWDEEAQQRLMRLLALGGRRSAALAQYETCRRLLAEELGVEPAAETTRLYHQIREGKLDEPKSPTTRSLGLPPRPPTFLGEEEPPEKERAPFVAREGELAGLDRFLDMALAGQGRVVFVTGGPGSGKTVLAREFIRRAMETHPDLVATLGNCNAHTGISDPYLPFLETVGMLTGDVEARWAGGTITTEHARRLWDLIPDSVQALLDAGGDLIDLFVPGDALLRNARTVASEGTEWLSRLAKRVERKAAGPGSAGLGQINLFEQVTGLLHDVSRQRPLIVVLDDLQWADNGSISLLFHLGRRLAGSRILIVGAYRPGDVAMERDGERHPLDPILNEFRSDFGAIEIDLAQADGRQFIDALLDRELNHLDGAFRETLYRHTGGHPLFTVELVRGLQERGYLVRDGAGRWIVGPELDWESLPARVEAVIEERISRLPVDCQAILAAASVEGEEFTAEVVARAVVGDVEAIIQRLSDELGATHRLIAAHSVQRVGSRNLSRYRFRHFLFQRYLYDSLDVVQRARLHETVGNALEDLHGEGEPEIAVQLARHFEAARLPDRAADCRLLAGKRAMWLAAHEEAIAHFTSGLELLEKLPDTPERAGRELLLRVSLSSPLKFSRPRSHQEALQLNITRVRELCRQPGETPESLPGLFGASWYFCVHKEYQTAHELAERSLALTQRMDEPRFLARAHLDMGAVLSCLGRFAPARVHFEQAIAHYESHLDRAQTLLYVFDVKVMSLSVGATHTLWPLGYPDQALLWIREAIALASELDHSIPMGYALYPAAVNDALRGQYGAARERAEACIALAAKHRIPRWEVSATALRDWAMVMEGEDEQVSRMAKVVAGWARQDRFGLPVFFPGLLAEACTEVEWKEEGLRSVEEALDTANRTGEGIILAELHRLKGELLLMRDEDAAGAEACFQQALDIARRQEAKSWELRAATSMSRLWGRQGKRSAATAGAGVRLVH